ncbi:MAG: S8 family serine peptidase [Pacificimonas sp.]|nr:S8 family serine peptidase [Pacificimonas sp.]
MTRTAAGAIAATLAVGATTAAANTGGGSNVITPQAGDLTGNYGFIIPVDGDVQTEYGFIIPVDATVNPDYGFIIPVEGDVAADYGFIIPVEGDVDTQYGFIIPVGGDVAPEYGFIIPVGGSVEGDYGFIIPVEGEIAGDYGFIIPVDGDLEGEYGFIIPVEGGIDGQYGFIIPVGGDVGSEYGFIIPVEGEVGTDYGFIIPVDGPLAGDYGFIIPVDDNDVRADYGFIIPVDGDVEGNYGFIIPVGGDATPDYGFIIPVDGDLSEAYGFIIPVDGSDHHGVYGTVQGGAADITTDYGFIIPAEGDVNGAYGFIIPVADEDIAGQYGFIIPVEGGGLTGSYGFIIPVEGDVDPNYGFIIPVSGEIIPEYGFIIPVIGDVDPDYGFIIPVGETQVVADYGFIIPVDGVQNRYGFIIPVDGVTENYGSILPGLDEILPDYGFIIPVEGDERVDLGLANPQFGYIIPDYGFIIPVDGEYRVLSEDEVGTNYGFIIPVDGEVAPYYGFIIPVDGMTDVFPTAQPVAGPNLIDHWLAGTRFSPVVSAAAGAGEGVTVGLLDFTVAGNADVLDAVTFADGISTHFEPHGTGVASLIVGGRFGFGVSGIAQRADLATFNPFDDTESTNFDDSEQGLLALAGQGASVINMSLGVENYIVAPEWADVLTHSDLASAVIVKAAGNDGVAQTENIAWDGKYDNLIFVGSVSTDGTISDFSNTPGSACLTTGGACTAGSSLMDRFLVAPGERITVADGEGGLLIASGTSVSAPMVTGAVALLHSRWPWLQDRPAESAEIIFRSARDLGAEGVDEVYGHGLLDIAASQRPLDDGTLTVSPFARSRTIFEMRRTGNLSNDRMASWRPVGGTRTAFEQIGSTYRDFVMPLSLSTLSQVAEDRGTDEAFQNMFTDFSLTSFAPRLAGEPVEQGVFGFGSFGTPAMKTSGGLSVSFSMAPTRAYFRSEGGANVETAVSLAGADGALQLTVGSGSGALAISGTETLASPNDTDLLTGGVNPVLGLASGDAFIGTQMQMADGLDLRFGASRRDFEANRFTELGGALRANFTPLDTYRASAMTVGARYSVSPAIALSGDITWLDEENAVLGLQSLDRETFGAGSETYAATAGVELSFGSFSLDASATAARTRAGEGEALSISGGSLESTAYQVALAKDGVFADADRVRFSVAQPLHVEGGSVNYRGYEITDRATGTFGLVDQELAIDAGTRTHVFEALYGAALLDGAAEVNAFARGEVGLDEQRLGTDRALTIGASFGIAF